jgi:hypothetical protein
MSKHRFEISLSIIKNELLSQLKREWGISFSHFTPQISITWDKIKLCYRIVITKFYDKNGFLFDYY